MADHYVEIYRYADRHVETRMGPMSRGDAERVRRGAMINMNHDAWGCRIVAGEAEEKGVNLPEPAQKEG